MKNKLFATILVLSLFASALTIAIQVSPVTATNEKVELYIDPSPVHKYPANVSTYFNVTVMIKNVTDLFGFDFNITWDNTLITYSASYYEDQLNAIWDTAWVLIKENATAGSFKFVALCTDIAESFTTTGNQSLLILEFQVQSCNCNFLRQTNIHFEVVKLSDSEWTEISPLVVTDGLYQMDPDTVPGLEFKLIGGENLEYGDEFEVEVNVTDICSYSPIKDYNFTILYNETLLEFVDVDHWGVLGDNVIGNASYTLHGLDKVQVWDTGDVFWSGNSGLLFALTFRVNSTDIIGHIWTTDGPNSLTAQVSFENATLSFDEGTIGMNNITMPSTPLDITIYLIQGDVSCDGMVDIIDLGAVASYYDISDGDPSWTEASKYNLNGDLTIDLFDLVIIGTNFWYGKP